MVTGASTADVAVILIDVRNGVLEQTVRHSCIASLLGIPDIIICINKMDLVDHSQKVFEKTRQDYLAMAAKMGRGNRFHFIPISAKNGDNVVDGFAQASSARGTA